jgi:hypothetical protein
LGIQPDQVLNLFNDPSPAGEQLDRVHDHITNFISEAKETGRTIRDVLIYYVGHGSCDQGHLHLLVRHSSAGREEQSSISISHLAQELRIAAPQQRRIVILDCCFSEAAATAFGAMGAVDEALAAAAIKNLEPGNPPPDRGTLLFCSSTRNSVSFGPPNDEWTLFTGALLSVLQQGSASRSEMLSFDDLREDVYDRMLLAGSGRVPPRPALHQTDQQSGDLTRLPAFPNPAWARRKAEEEERATEARRKAEEEERAVEERRKAEEEERAVEERRKADGEERATEARRKAEARRKVVEERWVAAEARPGFWNRHPTAIVLSIVATLVVLTFALTSSLVFWPTIDTPVAMTAKSTASSITGRTLPPEVPSAKPLTVAGNSAATPLGIPEPHDPNYRAGRLTIRATGVPLNGNVLVDGTELVTISQLLTVPQLTGLKFVPTKGVFDQSSVFTYSVTNDAGLTAEGSVTLIVGPSRTPLEGPSKRR